VHRELKGTIEFVSPEMARGEIYSFPTDVWSLGITLYDCALACTPFAGDPANCASTEAWQRRTLYNISYAEPLCISEIVDAERPISRALSDLLEDLLQPGAADRPTSAETYLVLSELCQSNHSPQELIKSVLF
jgi:serine/threonine protein kinase